MAVTENSRISVLTRCHLGLLCFRSGWTWGSESQGPFQFIVPQRMVPMLKMAPRAIFGKLLFFFLPTKRPEKCMPFTRRALTQFHPQLMLAFGWLELLFKTPSNWKRDCGRRKRGNTQTRESSGAMAGKGKGSMVTRRKHASFVPGIRHPSDPELCLSCLSRGWVWQTENWNSVTSALRSVTPRCGSKGELKSRDYGCLLKRRCEGDTVSFPQSNNN